MQSNLPRKWDAQKENQKAQFMEFLYERSGRTNGLFTGLWEEWDRECEGFGAETRQALFDTLKPGTKIEFQRDQVTISREEE